MASIGAPICVSFLRLFILAGLIVANPSILPFVDFGLRSIIFWTVVTTTISVYLKASLSDPGILKTCPSQYLAALEAVGGVIVTLESDLKIEKKTSIYSAESDGSIGRIRIRRRQPQKKEKYQKLKSQDNFHDKFYRRRGCSDDDQQQTSRYVPGRRTYGNQHRHHHKEKRNRIEQQLAIKKGRVNGNCSSISSLSSGHSYVDDPIDQRGWNQNPVDEDDYVCEDQQISDASWSDLSEHRSDVIVDFAKDSVDGYSEQITSSYDESSYSYIQSDDDHLSCSHQTSTELLKNLNNSTKDEDRLNNPIGARNPYETELTQFDNKQYVTDFKQSALHDSSTTTSLHPNELYSSNHSILAVSRGANVVAENTASNSDSAENCENEALYPFSTDESAGTIWKKAVDFVGQFPITKKTDQKEIQSKQHVEFFHCPNTLDFIKKSLGQVGVDVHPETTTSATVGATLTYAVVASAAAPFAVVGVAANKIASTARDVLGADSGVTKACQNINKSARQFNRSKYEDIGDEELTQVPSTHVDIESQMVSSDRQEIRSRATMDSKASPTPHHVSVTSGLVIVNAPELHHSPPIEPLCSDSIILITKSPPLIKIDPSVHFYRGILTRTQDGHPCQSRIQLRFCRICKKYQPLRTKHCSDCGYCVRTMDHHCPWLGSCVGENNRVWFFWFLIFQCFELLLAMVESGRVFLGARDLVNSIDDENTLNIGRVLFTNIYVIFSFLVMLFLFIMVVCLIGYHLFLALSNMTTWENIAWDRITYLKNLPEKKGSPFSSGVRNNLAIYCCPPTMWPIIRNRCVQYIQIEYGPDNEIIWHHGVQQRFSRCGDSSECCGCCSDDCC